MQISKVSYGSCGIHLVFDPYYYYFNKIGAGEHLQYLYNLFDLFRASSVLLFPTFSYFLGFVLLFPTFR